MTWVLDWPLREFRNGREGRESSRPGEQLDGKLMAKVCSVQASRGTWPQGGKWEGSQACRS